jgi:hypothetical protein
LQVCFPSILSVHLTSASHLSQVCFSIRFPSPVTRETFLAVKIPSTRIL